LAADENAVLSTKSTIFDTSKSRQQKLTVPTDETTQSFSAATATPSLTQFPPNTTIPPHLPNAPRNCHPPVPSRIPTLATLYPPRHHNHHPHLYRHMGCHPPGCTKEEDFALEEAETAACWEGIEGQAEFVSV
jgi:hypothetical protein